MAEFGRVRRRTTSPPEKVHFWRVGGEPRPPHLELLCGQRRKQSWYDEIVPSNILNLSGSVRLLFSEEQTPYVSHCGFLTSYRKWIVNLQ
ncbi:hypothetical protein HOLleu_16387 [Holothuria leucospilota]|uniref:Uncharacterized protein n=1 Tax=Holothuria leucospilota TaxID=206669 RepID=A0A9Q1C614_HOLLE|nr:hypothetical protein HOLleu_16387 [Holothuria leucospilota]